MFSWRYHEEVKVRMGRLAAARTVVWERTAATRRFRAREMRTPRPAATDRERKVERHSEERAASFLRWERERRAMHASATKVRSNAATKARRRRSLMVSV